MKVLNWTLDLVAGVLLLVGHPNIQLGVFSFTFFYCGLTGKALFSDAVFDSTMRGAFFISATITLAALHLKRDKE